MDIRIWFDKAVFFKKEPKFLSWLFFIISGQGPLKVLKSKGIIVENGRADYKKEKF